MVPNQSWLRTIQTLFVLVMLVSARPAWAQTPDGTSFALSSAQVLEDFDLAVDAVEAGLPNLYWNQSQRSWRDAKTEARVAASQVTDGPGLYRVLRPLMSRIGEGHLVFSRSDAIIAFERDSGVFLPLDLHFSGDAVFVIEGFGDAANIARGTRILAIDGEGPEALLRESMSVRGHDGFIPTEVMRSASGRGYASFRHRMRGDEASFHLRLQAPDGTISERTVGSVPTSARPKVETADVSPIPTLEWLDTQTAYLVVPTFSNRRLRAAGTTYDDEIKKVFEALQQGDAKNLILDLRENGGGSEPNEAILFSYLEARPLRRYAAVEVRAENLSVTSHSGQRFETEVFDEDELAQQRRLRNGRLVRINAPPLGLMSHWTAPSPVFTGRLVVLAGGNTFSGGAEASSMLFHAQRGVFVGEEVGGGDQGNTSGYGWALTLPNSGLKLSVPLLQYRMAWRPEIRGRGVFPHCPAPPDVMEIGVQRDRAWRTAVALMAQDWTRPRDAVCPPA